ncbi:hypothetical protein C2S51_023952 [Perilla frutescens var. frutescens]|nr:hypothetical protein C2S51_023952 [Perilla frutescens var. frutescens]
MAVSMISGMPAASSIFAMYASVSAFFMLVQTMVNGLVPRHMQQYLLDLLRRYFAPKATNSTAVVMIEEQAGMSVNEMYTAAETYLSSQRRPEIQRLKISKGWKDPGLTVRFADFDKIVDSHHDIKLEWRFVEEQMRENETAGQISEKKHFELSFDIKFRDEVLDSYLPSIIERARTIKATRKKVVKLHTLSSMGMGSNSMFDSINLEHPSTFETLAMEPEMKKMIVDDLDRFVRRKDFYRRVGKAWKRGYLLYGPPGTGKSSLIAAMANYLKFDIYDLELTNVHCDSVLRQLLLRTANRSIIVIEDIDCTVELPSRMPGGAYYPRLLALGAAQLHRRAMVELWGRADHHIHHKQQRQTRAGFAPAGANGRAHTHVLPHGRRVQDLSLDLPRRPRPPPTPLGDWRSYKGEEYHSYGNRGGAHEMPRRRRFMPRWDCTFSRE